MKSFHRNTKHASRIHLLGQVLQYPTDKLIPEVPHARTPSEQQVAQIAASIREFGFCNPILIDSAGHVIAGHSRLLAARKLGLHGVPVIMLDDATSREFTSGPVIASPRLPAS